MKKITVILVRKENFQKAITDFVPLNGIAIYNDGSRKNFNFGGFVLESKLSDNCDVLSGYDIKVSSGLKHYIELV